jgi:hypothetical protein
MTEEMPDHPLHEVTFRLAAVHIPAARAVRLILEQDKGETELPMGRVTDADWRVTVALAPGIHLYLFLVDGYPYNDPDDDGRAPCVWGGEYSMRAVPANGAGGAQISWRDVWKSAGGQVAFFPQPEGGFAVAAQGPP